LNFDYAIMVLMKSKQSVLSNWGVIYKATHRY
jgi:hypothetical protein